MKIPKAMQRDFLALRLNLTHGMRLDDDIKGRIIYFIDKSLPKLSESLFRKKLEVSVAVEEARKEGYGTAKRKDKKPNAFTLGAEITHHNIGEDSARSYYYEINKLILAAKKKVSSIPHPPESYDGPSAYIHGIKTPGVPGVLITHEGVFYASNSDSGTTHKLRDATPHDLKILDSLKNF